MDSNQQSLLQPGMFGCFHGTPYEHLVKYFSDISIYYFEYSVYIYSPLLIVVYAFLAFLVGGVVLYVSCISIFCQLCIGKDCFLLMDFLHMIDCFLSWTLEKLWLSEDLRNLTSVHENNFEHFLAALKQQFQDQRKHFCYALP